MVTPLQTNLPNIGNTAVRPLRDRKRQEEETPSSAPRKSPHRAHENYIPAPESLRTLIDNALFSLRKGTYWDRGSIVNLLL